MIKENKLLSRSVSTVTNGMINRNSKKAYILSWRTLLSKESPMSYSKIENKNLKNEQHLGCHLLYKPLNAEKTQYEFQVLPVLFILSKIKQSINISAGYYFFLHLSKPVEWDFFEKNVHKKEMLRVIRYALQSFWKDHEELKKDHKSLKDVSFSLPPDRELINVLIIKAGINPGNINTGKSKFRGF